MKKFELNIDDAIEDLFIELGKIQDEGNAHNSIFEAKDKEEAAHIISIRLISFFQRKIQEL